MDQHHLTIVSSDGYDVENIVVESFIINPGERFDFLLIANQSVGNYWFRAVSLEVSMIHYCLKKISNCDFMIISLLIQKSYEI